MSLTYIEGLHLLLKLPPGPLNGLVAAGLVREGLVRVGELRKGTGVQGGKMLNNLVGRSVYLPPARGCGGPCPPAPAVSSPPPAHSDKYHILK